MMKNIIIGLLFGILVMSCQLEVSEDYIDMTSEDYTDMTSEDYIDIDTRYDMALENKIVMDDLYIPSDFNATTMKDVIDYVKENIEGAFESIDVWSTARETLNRGYGDCEDFSIAFINLLYVATGIKANLIVVLHESRGIDEGGDVNHVIVELPDGTQIEPQNGNIVDYNIGYRYTFDEVISL